MRTKISDALRAQYLELDRRLLGVFRIYFGLMLLMDLSLRFRNLTFLYTNDGILPNHYVLYAPFTRPLFSLFFACSTKTEVAVAFSLTGLVYAALAVGYRTRLMQILTAILYTSLISRNPFIEMGGTFCTSLAAVWTVVLPLGDRFSVDSLRSTLGARREQKASALNDRSDLRPNRTPHVSLVTLAVLLQVTAIYFLNGVQKDGVEWKTGDAVHWVLWQDRIATSLCAFLRMHEPAWFSPLMTWGTLVVEESAPLMLLVPFVWKWTRSIYVPLAMSLHVGIALLVDVGPYSYIMLGLDLLMLPGFWFDWGARWLRKGKVARTVVYDPTDPALHWMARVLARVDTFELLRFVDRSEASSSSDLAGVPGSAVAVQRVGGPWTEGGDAVVDALGATPLGRAFAWFPLRGIVRALVKMRAPIARVCEWPPGLTESRPDPGAIVIVTPVRLRRLRVFLREALVSTFAFVVAMQIFRDNWWFDGKIPRSLRQGPPGALAQLPSYLRQNQAWMMFRGGPRYDENLIVDAETVDGRHVDPFTGKPTDFDVAFHGPRPHGQLIYDYFRCITDDGNARYRVSLGQYLARWQEITGRPERDRVRSYRVISVVRDSPPFGTTALKNVRTRVILEGP